ncbi:phenylacetate-CoA oxygenase subunit PaaJ [Mesobacillus subterraneus]|uniref:1,2-phenylacetyl-CoA epoxidase subunit PaaD n=1 Tax=Mesobacillus subterraneus TaxID=285983 RepID=UPI00203FA2E4|nr:1,2-phenylacetyl-CoA epoxidase subunit PaaD [Mesobacillus subterraneus]MCM3666435.1 phenylacetate-CoA oxygenase subunit PaaJ [Mesobacillus subterraneus]MCM3685434.1 phenylacetate-CoA oxygenase subunit PaaJ [Mesobacillus subterraneus]
MLRDKIIEALQTVKDPEIDSVSIIELGMVEEVENTPNGVFIKLLPTFMGCPALEIIKKNVVNAVTAIDEVQNVEVQFIYHPPWTSDRVSDIGRERLKEFGIAPPPRHIAETGEWQADCPYCGSTYTTMENLFGPTACRSILYCKSCKNPFEAMKPVSTLM